MKSDGELLREYAENGAHEAFGELGRRYAGMVYGICRREMNNPTLAEDAAQQVFLLLSQRAKSLIGNDSISGWLYRVSILTAKNLSRQERRRRDRERAAFGSTEGPTATSEDAETQAAVHQALNRLSDQDREAILLRYFQDSSLREVGEVLGLSENSARMRVSRALERLRSQLSRAGIAVSAVALVSLLTVRGAEAAPISLLRRIADIPSLPPAPVDAHRLGTVRSSVPTAVGLAIGGVLLIGGVIAWRSRDVALSSTERIALFARVQGRWQGSLEYADDRTGVRYTYPTQVSVTTDGRGDRIVFEARFTGSSRVDVTDFTLNPATQTFTVTNGGDQRSHDLTGAANLFRRGDDYSFEGFTSTQVGDLRIRLSPGNNTFAMQEEYRRGRGGYQFRNRFQLRR